MEFSEKNIDNISNLTRLKLTEEEKNKFKKDLNSIMNWIDTLKSIDVSNIEPLLNVSNYNCLMHEDVVFMENSREDILMNAPSPDKFKLDEREFFTVPKVIE